MFRLLKNQKIVLLAAILLVIAFSLAFLLMVKHDTENANPLRDSKLGFQYLYPAQLPRGIHIVSQRIDASHSPGGQFASVAAEMTFRQEDWVYGIRETKLKGENIPTQLNNYSVASTKPSCKQVAMSHQSSFRLCHWIDYGRISVFEVKLVKAGVYIEATLPTSIDKPITESELRTFVSSFEPADPSGLPILEDAV